MPNEISNTGRIVVKKRIAKIERGDSLQLTDRESRLFDNRIKNNGKMLERKKKGRLYSLGGNDPPKPRGRLDRLKTVGTFDLGTEMSVLTEVVRNLNERVISGDLLETQTTTTKRLSIIPAVSGNIQLLSGLNAAIDVKRDFSKSTGNFSSKTNSNKYFDQNSTIDIRLASVPFVRNQHSADELRSDIKQRCSRKPRSLSTDANLSQKSFDIKDNRHLSGNSLFKNLCPNEEEEVDSSKIEDDIRSFEDSSKNEHYQSSKPILKKSKNIVRSDSEIDIENISCRNEIILQSVTEIQIHDEPNKHRLSYRNNSLESNAKSRKDSSDFDEICSAQTDESSRNISTDELDTVFSDPNDLEQLEKDYREHLKSNLQREYKSDGDSLDEVGRKRNDYLKWKNQSFDNDIDFCEKNNPDSSMESSDVTHIKEKKFYSRKILCNTDIIEKYDEVISPPVKDNNFFSPMSTNSPQPYRPTDLDITNNATKPSSEGSISSLLEKKFSKFKKMNQLLKSKRFSSSALYDKKRLPIERTTETIRPVPTRSSPAKSSMLGSKSSINSSKTSLVLGFLSRKPSMFSNSSHSNGELNSSSHCLNEVSKSNSEINKYKTSPSRFSIKRASEEVININNNKNNSTACLNLEAPHSPISEEFYNKTGSVRLSAVELFEKFCSEDFGGLYKHEHFKNDERHEFYQKSGNRGTGAIRKYGIPARLLKQKSEPKFSLQRNDLYSEDNKEMYYHEELDEDVYYTGENFYNETDEYYEDDSCGGDEECEEEEDEYEYDEEDEEKLTKQKSIDAATSTDSDVDEIYLMPGKPFVLDRPPLMRIPGIDKSLNNLDGPGDDIPPELYTSAGRGQFEKLGSDEILTIYRMCSKDDLFMNEFSHSEHDLTIDRCIDYSNRDFTKSTPSFIEMSSDKKTDSSLENAVTQYLKNAPPDIPDQSFNPNFLKCVGASLDHAESMELLSNSSGTIRSGSTITEYAFDTVRNVNLDSCSTSKLSLSFKSEIFEEFTLTPDEAIPIVNCDMEDFTLTPDGSLCENASLTIINENKSKCASTENSINDGYEGSQSTDEQHNVIQMIDKFITNERIGPNSEESILGVPRKDTNIFNFDVDYDVQCDDGVISNFTTELTKEFDFLFEKADEENSKIDLSPDKNHFVKIPTRYSMNKLEPIMMEDDFKKNDPVILECDQNTSTSELKKDMCISLKTNRSQSLGNLSKKTRCFPL